MKASSGNPAQSSNKRAKRAHEKTLEALVKARQDFQSWTTALQKSEKESDRQFDKRYKEQWLYMKISCFLSAEERCKEMKRLTDSKQKADEARKQRAEFWYKITVSKQNLEEEIKKREEILKNWKDDRPAFGAKTLPGAQNHNAFPKFCTPECLLGLKQGGKLDMSCPNAARHQQVKKRGRHPISAIKLKFLINEQLSREQDDYQNLRCIGESMPGQPTYSRLGAFCSEPYGYTFLAKGYTYWWKRRAAHELDMYNRIDTFVKNGRERVVPVCFGLFDLPVPYPLPAQPEIKQHGENLGHILLLSYGTVATSTAADSSLGFDETMANKQLRTAVMGKYGIGFSEGTEYIALWENGRLMAIGLDEGSVIQWRYPVTRLRKKRLSRSLSVERFMANKVRYYERLRKRIEEKKKAGGATPPRWVPMVVDGTPGSPDNSLGSELP
ncbi:hypothetical protein B0T21DRAFT_412134 [Apiosordaria backusii]|uniref:Uncharacterized protein n=1 Tax=Apiosordaria backusii TaxID=314023 RepID=A0AA40EFD1_9PEZI|nr:hypothetical protein B0T21DRAFT_412134 [Apiosordaria backusii]